MRLLCLALHRGDIFSLSCLELCVRVGDEVWLKRATLGGQGFWLVRILTLGGRTVQPKLLLVNSLTSISPFQLVLLLPEGLGLTWRECWGENMTLGAGLQSCNSPKLSGTFSGLEPGQNFRNTFWIFLGSPNFITSHLFLDKTYEVYM